MGGLIPVERFMPARHSKLPSDGLMAEVCLGITVTGLYVLVGMGLMLAFM